MIAYGARKSTAPRPVVSNSSNFTKSSEWGKKKPVNLMDCFGSGRASLPRSRKPLLAAPSLVMSRSMDKDMRDRLLSLKLAHVQLNRAELKRAMEKRMDKPEKKFLDEDIGQGIGPWGTTSERG
jgi:hypothetical protein